MSKRKVMQHLVEAEKLLMKALTESNRSAPLSADHIDNALEQVHRAKLWLEYDFPRQCGPNTKTV